MSCAGLSSAGLHHHHPPRSQQHPKGLGHSSAAAGGDPGGCSSSPSLPPAPPSPPAPFVFWKERKKKIQTKKEKRDPGSGGAVPVLTPTAPALGPPIPCRAPRWGGAGGAVRAAGPGLQSCTAPRTPRPHPGPSVWVGSAYGAREGWACGGGGLHRALPHGTHGLLRGTARHALPLSPHTPRSVHPAAPTRGSPRVPVPSRPCRPAWPRARGC